MKADLGLLSAALSVDIPSASLRVDYTPDSVPLYISFRVVRGAGERPGLSIRLTSFSYSSEAFCLCQ